MEENNCKKLLTNPKQIPNEELFKEILSKQWYQTYKEIQKIISGFGFCAGWRYYKDGKSWLYKITQKRKQLFGFHSGKPFLNQVSILQKKAGVDWRVYILTQKLRRPFQKQNQSENYFVYSTWKMLQDWKSSKK